MLKKINHKMEISFWCVKFYISRSGYYDLSGYVTRLYDACKSLFKEKNYIKHLLYLSSKK